MPKMIAAALLAATTLTGVASAQTPELRQDRREVREERRDVRDAQRDVRDARRYGDRGDVREAREELRDERQDYRAERRDYREDRRDWREYRRDNRNVYRRSAYVGPVRGWRYRPVSVGYQFQPAYYGQRYWITDPYRYRLPRPAANRRWVRYGDDVALVNIRTGRVVTVYNNFFWR